MTATIFPRFLGVDGSGDFVWEREDGRWTWGENPYDAAKRERTLDPERYIEKFGRPIGLDEKVDRKAEWLMNPADLAKGYAVPVADSLDALTTGAYRALAGALEVLDGWIEGARENHDALGHRGEIDGEQCWQQFSPADIRNMINDVARELGVAEFPTPDICKEDEVG